MSSVDTFDGPLNGELLAEASEQGDYLPIPRVPMQQVKTAYTTAIAVQHPRDLQVVNKRLMAEAKLAGESFYYGWGSGRERIEGPSIGLAMAAARCFGNSAVDAMPIQETEDSWVMSSAYIDLETGFTLTRQFRQSKKSVVHGKHDNERKDDIRFQIGQSKSARNVVVNALPKWLIDAAIHEAKQGVRAKIEKYVNEKGLPAAVALVLGGLAKQGVTEPIVLDKCQVAKIEGLTIDHVVMLRGDLYALENGQDYASALFPGMAEQKEGKVTRSGVNDKLNATKEPEQKMPDNPAAATPEELAEMEREKAAKKPKGKKGELFEGGQQYE